MSTEAYKTAHIRIPAWLHDQIALMAKQERRSMSATIEIALEYYLDKDEPSFDERMAASIADVKEGRIHRFTNLEEFLKATTPSTHELSETEKHVPA